jgi:hypothetical protein
MKALSIRQPWVWAILHAGKRIENRCWYTRYRGPILLHAAQGMTRSDYFDFVDTYRSIEMGHRDFADPSHPRFRKETHVDVPSFDELQRGGIVGKARIVDCVTEHASPWFFGPNGFVLEDVEPLPFRPLKGSLGLFEVAP